MKKRQIFIELTSLLDVILIMLFMVMVRAEGKTTEAMENAEKNKQAYEQLTEDYEKLSGDYAAKESEAERLSEELDAANRQLIARDLVRENCDILTVGVLTDRRISLQSDSLSYRAIAYDWTDPNYAANKLQAALREWIKGAGDRNLFLVFQYDREGIYYNEYAMIQKAFRELKSDLKKQDRSFYYIELDVRE